MKKSLISAAGQVAAGATLAMVWASPALAGNPVPGPVLAAGAPALGLFAAGYYLVRKYSAR